MKSFSAAALVSVLLVATTSSSARAQAAATTPSSTPASTPTPATPDPTTTTTTTTDAGADTEPPSVVEVSIASDNPRVAPVITAALRDNVGVASVVAWWRVEGQPWKSVVLTGGPTWLGRLPDGPQQTGFSVWLEVKDAAGNVARVGAEASPLEIPAAVEGNNERVARQAAADVAFAGPHPAWVMLALGTGIAAGAGAGVFLYDINTLSNRGAQVDSLLDDDGLSDERRTELEGTRLELDRAITQDTAIVATLAVVGGAALVTGIALLTVSALEQ